MWIPDIGFSNSQGGMVHQVTDKNLKVSLGANGSVRMNTR